MAMCQRTPNGSAEHVRSWPPDGRRDLILGRRPPQLLRRYLEQLGVDHEVKVYDEAGHGFMTQGQHPVGRLVFLPMRYGYVAEAAADAWQRVFAFFDARLQPA